MKREYFGMLFIIAFTTIIVLVDYFTDFEIWDHISKFIVIWVLVGYYAGQYSMRFPKAF